MHPARAAWQVARRRSLLQPPAFLETTGVARGFTIPGTSTATPSVSVGPKGMRWAARVGRLVWRPAPHLQILGALPQQAELPGFPGYRPDLPRVEGLRSEILLHDKPEPALASDLFGCCFEAL